MADLLFLAHRVPYPPTKGDKIRSWQILRHLAVRYRVHLGCLYDDPEDRSSGRELAKLCATMCVPRLHPRLAKLRSLSGLLSGEPLSAVYFRSAELRGWVADTMGRSRPSRVFVYSSAMAPYVMRYRDATRILDMVDVDSEKFRAYAGAASWPMRPIYRREARTLLALERRAAMEFDSTLFVSRAEADVFLRLAPEAAGRVLSMSNGVDIDYFSPHHRFASPFDGGRPVILFTGAMDYRPNAEAVDWFVRHVMPLLRSGSSPPEFWVVGANPGAATRALADAADVHVTGRVPDVRPYIAHAAVSVAPLQIARGIQNKVLEAMAMAKPVIATPQAQEGIEAIEGEEILLARTPEAFAHHIRAAVSGSYAPIAQRARIKMESAYRWQENLRLLDRLLESQPASSALEMPMPPQFAASGAE